MGLDARVDDVAEVCRSAFDPSDLTRGPVFLTAPHDKLVEICLATLQNEIFELRSSPAFGGQVCSSNCVNRRNSPTPIRAYSPRI